MNIHGLSAFVPAANPTPAAAGPNPNPNPAPANVFAAVNSGNDKTSLSEGRHSEKLVPLPDMPQKLKQLQEAQQQRV